MCEYCIATIKQEIERHKENCVMQKQLEAQLRREGEAIPAFLLQHLIDLQTKNDMVRGWLSILSEDEAFVIHRHLLDKRTWPQLQEEHKTLWKEQGRDKRTLMRYQRNALKRIQRFIHAQAMFPVS